MGQQVIYEANDSRDLVHGQECVRHLLQANNVAAWNCSIEPYCMMQVFHKKEAIARRNFFEQTPHWTGGLLFISDFGLHDVQLSAALLS